MLKYVANKLPFVDFDDWKKIRSSLVFRSKSQLDNFQNIALRRILNHFEIPSLDVVEKSASLPPHKGGGVILRRSGTSGSHGREYHYSQPEYEIIEDHHIWRIEKSHGLEAPGVVVCVLYHPHPHTKNASETVGRPPKVVDATDCSVFGPQRFIPVGSHNSVYFLYFNEMTTPETWAYNLYLAGRLKPKFVLISPSVMETVALYAQDMFQCPAIVTGETLYESARSSGVFPKLIDKMRCWDGGLSWFECPHGKKHVYDELCYVEEIDGLLVSTDFHNRAMPFVRYVNQDIGDIEEGLCDCGIYGKMFKNFHGKYMESLVVNGKRMPGSVLYQIIGAYLRHGRYNVPTGDVASIKAWNNSDVIKSANLVWRVKQDKTGEITFRYYSENVLTEQQLFCLRSMLEHVLGSVSIVAASKQEFFSRKDSRTKSLAITSEMLK